MAMTDYITEIATSLIGLAGVTVTAWFGYKKVRTANIETSQAKSELQFQSHALSLTDFLGEWGEIHHELEDLMKNSEVDRFLILRAWNGLASPRWTTAVFQYRIGSHKPESYIHFELDADYVERLKQVVHSGSISFTTSEISDSAIKDVYAMEGVKSSAWFLIDKSAGPVAGSAAISYCSFASHSEDRIKPETMTRCRMVVGRLKGAAMRMMESRSS
jgi:hypothetical protein